MNMLATGLAECTSIKLTCEEEKREQYLHLNLLSMCDIKIRLSWSDQLITIVMGEYKK